MKIEFREIESVEEAKRVFPVMQELRTHLDEKAYLELLTSARYENGYKLIGAFELDDVQHSVGTPPEKCLGLLGYRILFDFVHGKHVYIDDLVVTQTIRSKGLGAKLLERAKEIAAEESCTRLRLCTGTENEAGKRFYEKNGWDLRAVVYKTKLNVESQ